ncbi:MAG: glucose-6-phosphate dehydrogenase [Phycisphaerales bacterium]
MATARVVAPVMPAPEHDPTVRAAAQEPFTLVLFGASGDLAGRKILPALFALHQAGFLPDNYIVVGSAVEALDDASFRQRARDAIVKHGRLKPANDAAWKEFGDRLFYQPADFGSAESFATLTARLMALEGERKLPGNRLFYLAIAPAFFGSAIERLAAAKLVVKAPAAAKPGENPGPWQRVVIEKPFGHDLESATELDRKIHGALNEDQIYRIDHYLGKDTVQNLLAFRFFNSIFEPLLSSLYVDHVQITVAETVGMEGKRGSFYDKTGALRDVGQNHLLQLLAYTAIDSPGGLRPSNIRAEKLRVLKNLMPIAGDDVAARVVRGQYAAGTVDGEAVPAYRDEIGVAPDSRTESYVAIRAHVDTWRWARVPFLLRTGKRMPERVTEIAVRFKQVPMRPPADMVELDGCNVDLTDPNVLVFRIQPNEGIMLSFLTKRPGLGFAVQPVRMEFGFEKSFGVLPEAYEHLVLDAIKGFQLLFMRSEEVDAQWKFVTPILEAWSDPSVAQPPTRFPNYVAGSWGPAEADHLAANVAGGWRHPSPGATSETAPTDT